MKTKKRIFAMIAVFIVCFIYISTFSVSAYRLYEMDCEYYPDTHEVEFTGMLGAAYYEIRAYAPGEDIAYNTGTLMSTFTPDTASTGEEYYKVTLGGDHDGPLDTALRSLEAQAYYTIKVYAYGAYVPVSSFSVKMKGINCTPDKTFDKVNNGGTYTARFTTSHASLKAEYGFISVTMGGVYIHNTDQVTTTTGDGYMEVTVTNVTGALYIQCSAQEHPKPDNLDAPDPHSDGDFLRWSSVAGATEYNVEIYQGGVNGKPVFGGFVADTEIDVSAHYTVDGNYYVRVRASYSAGLVYSAWSPWYTFELSAADIPVDPDSLDTPNCYIYEDNLTWSQVEGATEYLVEIRKGSTDGTLLLNSFIDDMGVDVGAYYTGDDSYYVRVNASYNRGERYSGWTQWYCFDLTNVSGNSSQNAPIDIPVAYSSDIDYVSVSSDVVIGESNPWVRVTGKGGGICKKPHIVDKNGDGYDDDSFIAGSDSSGSSLTDLIPKILGSVGGFFISVLGNMSVAGISLLTIASLACLATVVYLLLKVVIK